jgi:hypothetical protein
MIRAYHKHNILHRSPTQKRDGKDARLRLGQHAERAIWLAGVAILAASVVACDPVQIVEGSDTHVSIRYDGVINGLDEATQLAQKACAEHGRAARLRRTYYEGLGVGERFAFFDCV